jgi:glutathione-specific gamma-glutamylcyclotransferase
VAHDAFIHVPHLHGRLTPADKSAMRITREALAIYDERARKAGYPEDWRHSDQKIEESWRSFFSHRTKPSDLWVYGYGSLMWDPGFHFVEVRLADANPLQRPAFRSSESTRPFRIAADVAEAESEILWRREMITGGYCPAILSMRTPQGSITGLAFTSNTSHPRYVGELSLGETAAIIATGRGVIGTNRAYLEDMAAHLGALEIDDPYVERLVKEVNSIDVPILTSLEPKSIRS